MNEINHNMKPTGIVRPLDNLGRIVIPVEIRRAHGLLQEGQPMEIFADSEGCIIIKKYNPFCSLCGGSIELKKVKGKDFCMDCRNEICCTE